MCEDGQEGSWNTLPATLDNAQDIYNKDKGVTDHLLQYGAKQLGVDVARGLQPGKNYSLEVMFQVIANEEYFFLPGQKHQETVRFNFSVPTGAGISTVNALSASRARYTLSGQRVGKSYRGLVIENGKKLLLRR